MATGRGDGCADCHRHRALSGARTVIYGDPLPVHPPFPDTHPRWCPALAPTRHAPTVPATCATGDLLFRPVIHSCCYRVYWSSRCAVRCATSLACVGLALPAFEPMNTGLRNGSLARPAWSWWGGQRDRPLPGSPLRAVPRLHPNRWMETGPRGDRSRSASSGCCTSGSPRPGACVTVVELSGRYPLVGSAARCCWCAASAAGARRSLLAVARSAVGSATFARLASLRSLA